MTSSSQIDFDAASVTRSLRIEASPALVWATLTTPAHIAGWFGNTADFPDGLAPGSLGSFGFGDDGTFPVRIDTFAPTTSFAFTWGRPGEPIAEHNSTTATFTLEPDGDGTVLTVVESGFDRTDAGRDAVVANLKDNASGWDSELDELATYAAAALAGAPATASPDRSRITRSLLVEASLERTWAAVTDPEAIGQWWGHPAVFPDGMDAGADGTFEYVGHGLFPIQITVFDPMTTFSFLWGELGETTPGPGANLIAFTLTAVGEATLVHVAEHASGTTNEAHRGEGQFDRDEWIQENVQGWNAVLDALAAHVGGRRQSVSS